jgi:tRNA A-37 threonylcarbamoyl transferase component Bud32
MIAGRYELEHEIGRGGATSVWAGRDTVLGRRVALKRLGYSPGADEVDAARAEREAHMAARVHHPNIVAVYDVADDSQHSWLVMELVDGPTLADLCDGTPLDPDRALRLLAQVAEALAAAHAAGVVHRDVKPSNVLVADGDVAKLGDFGIARRELDEALTRTGLITGSPAFLAPEIARGRTATTASDVWAFGITAYQAATGSAPYDVADDDPITAVQTILDTAPPMLQADHPLAPVVAAAMHQDPDARASMRELSDLLHDLVDPGASRRSVLAELLADPPQREAGTADVGTAAMPSAAALHRAAAAAEATEEAPALPPREDRHRTRVTPLPVLDDVPTRPAREASPDRARRLGLLAAAAAVVVAAGVGVVLTAGGGGDDSTVATAGAGSSGGSAESTSERLERFAEDYVRTASSDPRKGYDLLTASYQQASGGLAGYEGFWSRVSDVRVERVSPDPDAMRVTYIYSYLIDGSRRTETVTLQLTRAGDRYLIEGAESV